MIETLLIVLLTLLALGGWAANALGMPGNWGIVALAGICFWFSSEESRTNVALLSLVLIVCIAIVGEVLEFLASAMGASRVGGSRRGAILALLGSITGAIVGLVMGTAIPPPIVGNVMASLLLGASGAFAGAIAGERWDGKEWEQSIQIGTAAFWGRLLGTVGKAVCGTIACGVFLLSIWL